MITALENHFQATRTTHEINHHNITQVIEVDLQNKEFHKIDIIDQIVKIIKIEITVHDGIQTQQNLFLHPVPIQTPGIDTFPTKDHETHHTKEIEINPAIGIEVTQINEINFIKTTDQKRIPTIDQIIDDLTIITEIDQEKNQKIETQAITIDK